MRKRLYSFRVLYGGANAGSENANEFVALDQERVQPIVGNKFDACDETKPRPNFLQLLKTNAEFVDEIFARFRSLNFAMIGEWRGAASKQLAGNVVFSSRIWQRVREFRESRRKFEQPVLQIEFTFTRAGDVCAILGLIFTNADPLNVER